MELQLKDYSKLPLTLNVDEVAEIMRIGRVQAYNLVHSEDFPKKIIGRRIVIPTQAFINWLNAPNA